MSVTYETRAVLASAKRGMARLHPECNRTHLVALPEGRTFCRIKAASLADRDATDPTAAPTCEDCRRAWDGAAALRRAKAEDDARALVIELAAALRDLRDAATDAYGAGHIPAEPFVRAGNVLAKVLP